MQSHSRSLSDRSPFHPALIAFVCAVMVLLGGSSLTRLTGTDWPTRQTNDRVEQIEAPKHSAVPTLRHDIRFAEDHLNELVEPNKPTDDDETRNCVLHSGVATFGSQTGHYDLTTSADRALTPFQLLAFSSRGSPSA